MWLLIAGCAPVSTTERESKRTGPRVWRERTWLVRVINAATFETKFHGCLIEVVWRDYTLNELWCHLERENVNNAYQLIRAIRFQICLGRSFQLRWLIAQGMFHIHQQLHITNTNSSPLKINRWSARRWLINVQENLLSGRRLSFRYRVPHVYAVKWNGIIVVWCT